MCEFHPFYVATVFEFYGMKYVIIVTILDIENISWYVFWYNNTKNVVVHIFYQNCIGFSNELSYKCCYRLNAWFVFENYLPYIGRKASTYTLVCIRLFIYCVCSSLFWLLIIVKVGGSSSNAYSHIFLIIFSYSSPSVKNNNSCCTYPGGLSMKK